MTPLASAHVQGLARPPLNCCEDPPPPSSSSFPFSPGMEMMIVPGGDERRERHRKGREEKKVGHTESFILMRYSGARGAKEHPCV